MATAIKELGGRILSTVVPQTEAGACIPEAGMSCGCFMLMVCDSSYCYYDYFNSYLTCTGKCTTNWTYC